MLCMLSLAGPVLLLLLLLLVLAAAGYILLVASQIWTDAVKQATEFCACVVCFCMWDGCPTLGSAGVKHVLQ